MRRLKLLCFLPVLCLTACKSNSYYGDYSFGLGKTNGSHFGFTVSLSKDEYQGKADYKKIKISAEFGDDFSIGEMIESYGEQYPIIGIIFDLFFKDVKNISEINGYYRISNEHPSDKYGKRVLIGSEEITNLLKQSEIEYIKDLEFDVTPDIVKYVAMAYTTKKEFTFQLPVSIDDVKQQLMWYGIFFDLDNPDPEFILPKQYDFTTDDRFPGAKDESRFGSHPVVKKDKHGVVVEDQVKIMNENFRYEFSHTPLYNSADDTILGKFYQEKNEEGKKRLYFIPSATLTDTEHVSGYVQTMDLLGNYEVKKDITFSYNKDTYETNVTYQAAEESSKESFVDENSATFKFTDVIRPPFVYRDYHDVKIGLKKQ